MWSICSGLWSICSAVWAFNKNVSRACEFSPSRTCTPDTKVPEEMQFNVAKKQREMVLLEESLYAMQSRFNARFLSLRAIKREILTTVATDNRRLREIDAELGRRPGDGVW